MLQLTYEPRRRRSLLITSVLIDGHVEKSAASDADVSWLELEDGVHESKKEVARERVVEALRDVHWNGKERIVRVNKVAGPWGAEDILAAARGGATAVLLPKVDGPWEVKVAEALIEQVDPQSRTKIWCMIESARGVMTVEEIAFASPRMDGLFFGAGDFSADIGVRSMQLGSKSHSSSRGVARNPEYNYGRSRVVVAAAAAGIWRFEGATDSRRDYEAVYDNAQRSFQFGFDGVSMITPLHAEHVHRAYAPSEEDLQWAQEVVNGANADASESNTVGVVNDAMVDGPVYLHAQQILSRAAADEKPTLIEELM